MLIKSKLITTSSLGGHATWQHSVRHTESKHAYRITHTPRYTIYLQRAERAEC